MYLHKNILQMPLPKSAAQRHNIAISPRQFERASFEEQLVIILFSNRKPSEHLMIELIAHNIMRGGACWVSQKTLGDYAGITGWAANRNIGKLAKDGLVGKEFRYFRTCLYQLPKILFRKKIRAALGLWMPYLSQAGKLKVMVECADYNKIVPIFVGYTTKKSAVLEEEYFP